MKEDSSGGSGQVADPEWVPLSGGDLEARRPGVLCPACRARARGGSIARLLSWGTSRRKVLCFECFRMGLARDRGLAHAQAAVATSTTEADHVRRLAPVNRERLELLRMARTTTRAEDTSGSSVYEQRRHQAQIAARHELARSDMCRASAMRAAELRFPESWLPFVVWR